MVREEKLAQQLPKQQLLILAICRFAEPVAMTSVYPYIPEMIQSFHVPDDKVARWAGLMSAVFSLSQCLTAIAWGRASDRFGRKPVILLALTCTMVSSILFGFSKNLKWAFITRSMQGLSNGNVGIIRTAVAEMVPRRELQPLAFSIMPLVWNIGSIFGPSFGGSLARPAERYPSIFGKVRFLKDHPFALPNLVISLLYICGISAGFLFLRETLEEKKSRRDYGLLLGRALTTPCTRKRQRPRAFSTSETDPFLRGTSSEMSSPRRGVMTKPQKNPGWADVFSRQSNINLVVYTFLAMHSVAFDQLLSIFMHFPVQSIRDPNVHLPFKFAGGFGIDASRIGLLFTVYGTFGMLVQFLIFPRFAKRFGVLNCLKACTLMFPLVYLATPFTALLPTDSSRQGVMLLLMLVKGFSGIFAFPCSTILLTNSAASLKVLGTLNGVATSVSAIGRATGPALAGGIFTLGVDMGYVALSWWTLALIGIIGAVPVWFLVEMEGFSSGADDEDDDDDDDDELEEEEDGDAKASAVSPLEAHSRQSSGAALNDDVFIDDESPSESRPLTRATSRASLAVPRRHSLHLHRVASPIGMGSGIIPTGARRYSSDLGATRSGLGVGGTTYY